MPTLTELLSRRDALSAQRSSGVARVSYDGKSIQYGSAADLLARIRLIEADIAAQNGRPKPRRSFASFSKG